MTSRSESSQNFGALQAKTPFHLVCHLTVHIKNNFSSLKKNTQPTETISCQFSPRSASWTPKKSWGNAVRTSRITGSDLPHILSVTTWKPSRVTTSVISASALSSRIPIAVSKGSGAFRSGKTVVSKGLTAGTKFSMILQRSSSTTCKHLSTPVSKSIVFDLSLTYQNPPWRVA